tara:strand:- start:89 stop:286 length:198 start_codon:yes stop_codon:yes gene_type:complete
MSIKPRVKKLSIEDRQAIIELALSKKHTYAYIGKLFGVSRGRVSQLVNNTYDENKFFGGGSAVQD